MDNKNLDFGFLPVASLITPVSPDKIARPLQDELTRLGGIKLANEDVCKNIPLIFLVLTGGTEQQVWDLYSRRDKCFPKEPILIAAHKSNNSLPASLEVLAKFQQEGIEGNIIYIDDSLSEQNLTELEHRLSYFSVYHKMREAKIGLIGEPSDWLLASSPDVDSIQSKWGPEVKKIDINDLISSIENESNAGLEKSYTEFTGSADLVSGPSSEDIFSALKVYSALKKIIAAHKLSAVSVRCFDLVIDLKTTGCYSLARLNDEGIIAGCEGDMVSTIGMMWLNYFTGQQVWMANPARLDEKSNSLWLAHCTVPINMVKSYKILTHFESGLGAGIQGEFKKEEVTLLRLGGKTLNKIWLAEGEIVECGNDENLCRTQVKIKLKEGAKPSDLLNNPLGNHLLMVPGSYAAGLMEWWKAFIN